MRVEDFALEGDIEKRIENREKGSFTLFNAVKIANEVAQCILKMHTNHIVHLDLKPANEDRSARMAKKKLNIDNFRCPSCGCTPAFASLLAKGVPCPTRPQNITHSNLMCLIRTQLVQHNLSSLGHLQKPTTRNLKMEQPIISINGNSILKLKVVQ
eukprot:TRINITY_DN9281_c0_g2_i1.p2 TRINITY_DN9281_c0_g2~~TRINITY_DN9281_c0_g2_i1.p2  ORF type:complete len:156 (-),score=25.06 TRINITY_DN9281_c0_g2_i1:98-565(-)